MIKKLLEAADYIIPPPLTRDEIKTALEKNGYPIDNSRAIDDIIKIVRILEKDGYGIQITRECDKMFIERFLVFKGLLDEYESKVLN